METVDDLIERKIKKQLGLYDKEKRRTQNEIRDRIQEELEKRPKTIPELKNALSASRSTIDNHLEHLHKMDIVRTKEVEGTVYYELS